MAINGDDGPNSLPGTSGSDIIVGYAGNDTERGGGGNDILYGDDDNDLLYGDGEDDYLFGGSGDDTLYGGIGFDRLYGESGNDTFKLVGTEYILDDIYGGAGTDVLDYSNAMYAGFTFDFKGQTANGPSYPSPTALEGIEIFYDGPGGDTIISDGGSHLYFGMGGGDRMVAEIGVETMHGGDGIDTLDLSRGDLSLFFNMTTGETNQVGELFTGFENVVFGSGNDTLWGTSGDETAYGGAGDDFFQMGNGNDNVLGETGNDTVSFERASGEVGASLVTGMATWGSGSVLFDSIENLEGSPFSDMLIGGPDTNKLFGLGGDDTLVSNGGSDQLKGGRGSDWVSYQFAGSGVKLDLAQKKGISGFAAGDTYGSVENALGSAFADKLKGSSGANALTGGKGKDTLMGGKGVDHLDGGRGNDILDGGGGIDYAVFHHKRSDYTIHKSGGSVTVDYNGRGEGTDNLTDVEVLHFADRDLIV